MIFEIFTPVFLKIDIFWYVTLHCVSIFNPFRCTTLSIFSLKKRNQYWTSLCVHNFC